MMARYIDADVLTDNLVGRINHEWNKQMTTRWSNAYEEFVDVVESIPTAELPIKEKCCVCPYCDNCDVNEDGIIERKKGEWIKQDDEQCWWYECSVCGDYPLKNSYGHDVLSVYCPNCGAQMRGEQE